MDASDDELDEANKSLAELKAALKKVAALSEEELNQRLDELGDKRLRRLIKRMHNLMGMIQDQQILHRFRQSKGGSA